MAKTKNKITTILPNNKTTPLTNPPQQITPTPRSASPDIADRAATNAPSRKVAADLSETTRLHSMILDRLGPSPLAEDQLMRDLSLPTAQLIPELLTLELEGRIQRQAGGLLSLR